jgi:hypothetical protein
MSDLDEWFGPREVTAEGEIVVRRTKFPAAEEPIRPILDRMLAIWEAEGRQAAKAFVATWTQGARDYVEQVDGDADRFERAMRLLIAKGLTIRSPRSMIAVALDMKAKEQPKKTDYGVCPDCGAPFGLHNRDCEAYE